MIFKTVEEIFSFINDILCTMYYYNCHHYHHHRVFPLYRVSELGSCHRISQRMLTSCDKSSVLKRQDKRDILNIGLWMIYRLYSDIATCPEVHTEHINALRGQNMEMLILNLVVHIVTTGL